MFKTNSVKRKKVLFLLAYLHKGGMQKAVSNITRAISCDFDLHVAYFGTENPGFVYDAVQHNFNLSSPSKTGILSKIVNFRKRPKMLKSYVNENDIDYVVSFGEGASIINLLSNHSAKKYLSIRVSLVASLNCGLYGRIYKMLMTWLYPQADMVISASHALKQEVLHYTKGEVPIKVINNLYFTEEIKLQSAEPLPKGFTYLKNKKFIVNVGSYCYQKGQDILIEAFAKSEFCKEGNLLVLVGRGPCEKNLKEQVRYLSLEEQVVFTGFQSNPYSFINYSRLFVLSSRYEGFPNVLVESMIIGKPIIAFDCPTGPCEILNNDLQKSLICMGDLKALSEKIDDTTHEKDIELIVKRGTEFDYTNIKDQWSSIFINSKV